MVGRAAKAARQFENTTKSKEEGTAERPRRPHELVSYPLRGSEADVGTSNKRRCIVRQAGNSCIEETAADEFFANQV